MVLRSKNKLDLILIDGLSFPQLEYTSFITALPKLRPLRAAMWAKPGFPAKRDPAPRDKLTRPWMAKRLKALRRKPRPSRTGKLIKSLDPKPLEPVVGYQQDLATLLTGKKPDEINVWAWYRRASEKSIFSWTKLLPNISFFDKPYPKLFINFVSFLIAGIEDMNKAYIPLKLMPFFDIGHRRGSIMGNNAFLYPTVFERLKSKGFSSSYIKGGLVYENNTFQRLSFIRHLFKRDYLTTLKLAKKSSDDFRFIYLVDLDGINHRFGPFSHQARSFIKRLDSQVERFVNDSKRETMIISDHGFCPVKKRINLMKAITSLGLANGEGFLFFLDSTLARFWFFDQQVKKRVLAILKKIKQGHLLSKKEKKRYGIDFKDDRFGEEIFLLDEGCVFWPDFFTKDKNSVNKGMHGYLPSKNENAIIAMTKGGDLNKKVYSFTEVFGLINSHFVDGA